MLSVAVRDLHLHLLLFLVLVQHGEKDSWSKSCHVLTIIGYNNNASPSQNVSLESSC